MKHNTLKQKQFVGIPIYAGDQVAGYSLISFEDAERVLEVTNKWRINTCGYAYCRKGSDPNRELILLHRLILNPEPHQHIDHINRDRLDNRRYNLRLATPAQNVMNRSYKGDKTSGFIGVQRQGNGYIARIGVARNRLYLGRFPTPEEAARAYDMAAQQHYGEFAPQNFPQ